MTRITLHGHAVYTEGSLPRVGAAAPKLSLTSSRLTDVGLDDFGHTRKVLYVVPSLETSLCAPAVRRIAGLVRHLADTALLLVSADLPFASQRLCDSFGLASAVALSTFRNPAFARGWGVQIVSGPMRGLPAQALFALGADHSVLHAQLVRELDSEPDYAAVAEALDPASIPVADRPTRAGCHPRGAPGS